MTPAPAATDAGGTRVRHAAHHDPISSAASTARARLAGASSSAPLSHTPEGRAARSSAPLLSAPAVIVVLVMSERVGGVSGRGCGAPAGAVIPATVSAAVSAAIKPAAVGTAVATNASGGIGAVRADVVVGIGRGAGPGRH